MRPWRIALMISALAACSLYGSGREVTESLAAAEAAFRLEGPPLTSSPKPLVREDGILLLPGDTWSSERPVMAATEHDGAWALRPTALAVPPRRILLCAHGDTAVYRDYDDPRREMTRVHRLDLSSGEWSVIDGADLLVWADCAVTDWADNIVPGLPARVLALFKPVTPALGLLAVLEEGDGYSVHRFAPDGETHRLATRSFRNRPTLRVRPVGDQGVFLVSAQSNGPDSVMVLGRMTKEAPDPVFLDVPDGPWLNVSLAMGGGPWGLSIPVHDDPIVLDAPLKGARYDRRLLISGREGGMAVVADDCTSYATEDQVICVRWQRHGKRTDDPSYEETVELRLFDLRPLR